MICNFCKNLVESLENKMCRFCSKGYCKDHGNQEFNMCNKCMEYRKKMIG